MINTRRNSFTKEEDDTIIRFVKEHGPQNWNDITSIIETRTGAQCRERWKKYLSPSNSREYLSQEEDE
jgi:myb proto-oncogene protein